MDIFIRELVNEIRFNFNLNIRTVSIEESPVKDCYLLKLDINQDYFIDNGDPSISFKQLKFIVNRLSKEYLNDINIVSIHLII